MITHMRMTAMRKTIKLIGTALLAGCMGFIGCSTLQSAHWNRQHPLSLNKMTVQKYMDGFNKTDHAQVLSCLTDNVEWVVPGVFHINGKEAFDKEIENPAFVGSPHIKLTRMIEEDGVVIAEGSVRPARKEGGFLNAVFCDVFVMQDAKIKQLTSYLMEVKE
jgi:uncharacterized protein